MRRWLRALWFDKVQALARIEDLEGRVRTLETDTTDLRAKLSKASVIIGLKPRANRVPEESVR